MLAFVSKKPLCCMNGGNGYGYIRPKVRTAVVFTQQRPRCSGLRRVVPCRDFPKQANAR